MLDCEMNCVEGFLVASGYHGETLASWNRIKTALAEAQKQSATPHNKQSEPFDVQPCCEGNEWLCSVCGKSARFY